LSIIYDALKKVEKNVNKTSSDKEEPKNNNTKKPRPILIYIFVILLGLYAGNMVFGLWARPKAKPSSPPTISEVTTNKISAPIQPIKTTLAVEPTQTRAPTLILNGVFFQQDQGYALINNRILKINDTILEAKVEEISLEKVVLEFEGKKITLINTSR